MANLQGSTQGGDPTPNPTHHAPEKRKSPRLDPVALESGGVLTWRGRAKRVIRSIGVFLRRWDPHCYHPKKVVGIVPDGRSHGPFKVGQDWNSEPRCCRCGMGKKP